MSAALEAAMLEAHGIALKLAAQSPGHTRIAFYVALIHTALGMECTTPELRRIRDLVIGSIDKLAVGVN